MSTEHLHLDGFESGVQQKRKPSERVRDEDDIGLECHFRFAEMYGANSVKPEFGRCPLDICI